MRDSFKVALKPILAHEGKFSNDAHDPGGATMWGVTQRVYDAYSKMHGKPQQSVANISIAERDDIYMENYWTPVRGDELPLGIDYCVFDGSLNSGPTQAGKWLQRSLAHEGVYKGAIDGHIGTGTLAALDDVHASEDDIGDRLIDHMCDQRLAFMRSLKNYPFFKNGWETRVRDVRRIAKQMNNHQVVSSATQLMGTDSAKAYPSETKLTETPTGSMATKEVTLGGGGIVTFLLSKFDSFSDNMGFLTGMEPATAKILIEGVVVVALLGLVGYGAHSLWTTVLRRRRGEGVEAE